MRTGQLAAASGVNVQTIRFYERKGLLRKPARTAGGYRAYREADLEIVRTIRLAQRFGFTLREIRRMLELYAFPDERTGQLRYRPGSSVCREEVAAICGRKLTALDERIRALRAVRRELVDVIRRLRAPARR